MGVDCGILDGKLFGAEVRLIASGVMPGRWIESIVRSDKMRHTRNKLLPSMERSVSQCRARIPVNVNL